jgi:hypothetical protein
VVVLLDTCTVGMDVIPNVCAWPQHILFCYLSCNPLIVEEPLFFLQLHSRAKNPTVCRFFIYKWKNVQM